MTTKWLQPQELDGRLVKIIPLVEDHRQDLLHAAADGELWHLWFTSVPDASRIDAYLKFAFDEAEAGRSLPFAVWHQKDKKIIGSTRYCNADPGHRRLEIGYTWYSQSYQRTGVNTECKYLLLKHAFENLDAIAVEFRTHWHNVRSRKAILRLGAKQDGVLRNHRLLEDGSYRDTVVYSILPNEWPGVKQSLEYELMRTR